MRVVREIQHRGIHGNILISTAKHVRVCWSCGKKYKGRWRQGICDECLSSDLDVNSKKN